MRLILIFALTVMLTAGAAADRLDFAFDLYRVRAAGEAGNILLSPASISSAFTMLYGGADRETAAAIAKVFGYAADPVAVAHRERLLVQNFRQNRDIELKIDNSMWIEKSADLKQDYFAFVTKNCGGALYQVEFQHDAPAAIARINRYVAESTGDRIKALLGPGSCNEQTSLVLLNTILFSGRWESEFKQAFSKIAKFDRRYPVTMMHQTTRLPYGETGKLQIIALPYRNAYFQLLVLLPKTPGPQALAHLEQSLTATEFRALLAGLSSERKIKLALPRFAMRQSIDLVPELSTLGLGQLFTRYTGLSGIGKNLRLSRVGQQCVIEVDEGGTRAAAATVLVAEAKCAPEHPLINFTADRPFLFILCERRTNTILFIGRMVEPDQP